MCYWISHLSLRAHIEQTTGRATTKWLYKSRYIHAQHAEPMAYDLD